MGNNESINDILSLVSRLGGYIWTIVGVALLGMVIYGGFMWAISSENPQNIQKAQSILMWAFIGAAVALLAFVVMNVFSQVISGGQLDFSRITW